ncbi:MAG: 3-deoxy-manno-octulosonate cytidylyltransferase [Gammaproteobacteria bacterium]
MQNTSFQVVIPARFASTRFPGKVLTMLAGRPVIEHVWRRAKQSGAAGVIIATDDERIAAAGRAFGADVQLTHAGHRSGTERAAEVATVRGWPDDVLVVNCQGDAPLIPPACINQVAELLAAHPDAAIATLSTPIDNVADYRSADVVKVVCAADGRALYFSRSPIPATSHATTPGSIALPASLRHVGLYAYRVAALKRLAGAPPCELEITESLEQLRALWLGLQIQVGQAVEALGPDVDSPEDLARAVNFLNTA